MKINKKRSLYVDASVVALLIILLFIVNHGFIRRHSSVAASNDARALAAPAANVPTSEVLMRVLAKATPVPTPAAIPVSYRPLNFALLRGGFTTSDEFFERVSQDPILHSFYGDCSDRHATMRAIPEDVRVFTAFRRGNQIKWAQRPLLVRKGEYVLTYCGKTVLARCGNLISMAAMQPSEDIPPGLLEAPVDPIEPPLTYASEPVESVVESVAAAVPAAAHSRFFFFVPPFYIPSGGGHSPAPPVLGAPPPVSHVSGDEFSGHYAFFTLLLGFATIGVLKLFTR
jgi:hypothetical protein